MSITISADQELLAKVKMLEEENKNLKENNKKTTEFLINATIDKDKEIKELKLKNAYYDGFLDKIIDEDELCEWDTWVNFVEKKSVLDGVRLFGFEGDKNEEEDEEEDDLDNDDDEDKNEEIFYFSYDEEGYNFFEDTKSLMSKTPRMEDCYVYEGKTTKERIEEGDDDYREVDVLEYLKNKN
jgi:hypothetical protein